MSFVAWLALPVAVTTVVTVIMMLAGRRPHTDTHQDIESFARFRGALERQTMPDRAAAEASSGAVRSDTAPPSGH